MAAFRIKRIYEPAAAGDGFRVLVDRLWPRGVSREDAGIDLWLKEIGPTPELRKWFDHDPERFPEFRKRYLKELQSNAEVAELAALAGDHDTITLLYGANDEEHNQAVVLLAMLNE